jgi:hypothetical protein
LNEIALGQSSMSMKKKVSCRQLVENKKFTPLDDYFKKVLDHGKLCSIGVSENAAYCQIILYFLID